MRKVLETRLFLALGSFGTLGPKLSHGTSSKFADVRTHLRKVSKMTLSTNQELPYLMVMGSSFLFFLFGSVCLKIRYKIPAGRKQKSHMTSSPLLFTARGRCFRLTDGHPRFNAWRYLLQAVLND